MLTPEELDRIDDEINYNREHIVYCCMCEQRLYDGEPYFQIDEGVDECYCEDCWESYVDSTIRHIV